MFRSAVVDKVQYSQSQLRRARGKRTKQRLWQERNSLSACLRNLPSYPAQHWWQPEHEVPPSSVSVDERWEAAAHVVSCNASARELALVDLAEVSKVSDIMDELNHCLCHWLYHGETPSTRMESEAEKLYHDDGLGHKEENGLEWLAGCA